LQSIKTKQMEHIEKTMSYEQSLAIIQSMIDTAKNKVADDGFHLIMWGVLVIICCLVNYLLIISGNTNLSVIPWLIMPAIGIPLGIWYEKRLKKEGHAKTHLEKHIAYMWWGYGITIFLSLFYCIFIQTSPVPFILLATGLVTFATGLTIKFKPLIAGGLVFWLLTLICPFVQPVYHLLIEAVGIFLGYIIPGILLMKEAKSSSHV
jgi:hypothetical protein